MTHDPTAIVDQTLLHTLKTQFEGLRRSQDGEVLYKLIARGLAKFGNGRERIEWAFLNFLHGLLGRYASDRKSDPATRIKARLIQQRLTVYLSAAETAAPAAAAVEPAAAGDVASTEPTTNAVPAPAVDNVLPAEPEPRDLHKPPPDAPPIDVLQESLAKGLTDSIAADKGVIAALREQGGNEENLEAFGDLKTLFMRGLDELIRERRELKQRLTGAAEYLRAVDADRERLNQELTDARKHGLVDELTGLPKREVFMRSLEAEIGRVKRYGFALALALVDLDDFGALNERYGRNAGDAVLRCYAKDILSKFRAYDLVARYGGDEFAILFPNTQKDGALRALEKARRAAAESVLSFGGKNLALPGFSSVLTLYSPGERPAALLDRAAQALDSAKRAGGSRTVTALPAG